MLLERRRPRCPSNCGTTRGSRARSPAFFDLALESEFVFNVKSVSWALMLCIDGVEGSMSSGPAFRGISPTNILVRSLNCQLSCKRAILLPRASLCARSISHFAFSAPWSAGGALREKQPTTAPRPHRTAASESTQATLFMRMPQRGRRPGRLPGHASVGEQVASARLQMRHVHVLGATVILGLPLLLRKAQYHDNWALSVDRRTAATVVTRPRRRFVGRQRD